MQERPDTFEDEVRFWSRGLLDLLDLIRLGLVYVATPKYNELMAHAYSKFRNIPSTAVLIL